MGMSLLSWSTPSSCTVVSTYAPTIRCPSEYRLIDSGASTSSIRESSHPVRPCASRPSHQSSIAIGGGTEASALAAPAVFADFPVAADFVGANPPGMGFGSVARSSNCIFSPPPQPVEAFRLPARLQVQVHLVPHYSRRHRRIALMRLPERLKRVENLLGRHRLLAGPAHLALLPLHPDEAPAALQNLESLPVLDRAGSVGHRRDPVTQKRLLSRHIDIRSRRFRT